MKDALRIAGAVSLGAALALMPLFILSFDPESRLERLRTPLCRGTIAVNATAPNGGDTLRVGETGVRVNATLDGAPAAVRLSLFVKHPGNDWEHQWSLDAPEGREIFFIITQAGTEVQVRGLDPSGAACPGDSRVLRAASQQ